MTQIQSTNDYSIFKFMTGNREIDRNHVAKLKKEMLETGNLMEVMPILVNENMFIVDGQHRFEAAKDIGMNIHYIMRKNATISTARHMNVTQKNWDIMDFARSFAKGGNQNYEKFITMRNKFPQLSPSIIILLMSGGDRNGMGDDFRRGLFSAGDIAHSQAILEQINEIRLRTNISPNMPMARALLRLLDGDTEAAANFDFQRFISKLEMPSARVMYALGSSVKQSLQTIETVYNFQSPVRTVLF